MKALKPWRSIHDAYGRDVLLLTCVILSERGIYGSLLRKRRRLEYLVAYLACNSSFTIYNTLLSCAKGRCNSTAVLIIILAFSLVFAPYLPNAVVSRESPCYFSGPCRSEPVCIAHRPPRSL